MGSGPSMKRKKFRLSAKKRATKDKIHKLLLKMEISGYFSQTDKMVYLMAIFVITAIRRYFAFTLQAITDSAIRDSCKLSNLGRFIRNLIAIPFQ